jgi:shikimate kinase
VKKCIVLMGYMGSGKSSVARFLANKTEINHLDLDDFIEKREQLTIPEIFKTKGEIYFRKTESECLKELLESKNDTIISLGGGTPCYGDNLDFIKNTSKVVSFYLSASIESLTERLFKEKNNRPLISHFDTLEALNDFVRKHLFERNYYYNQANYLIKTDGKSVEEIAEEINCKLL